MSLSAIIAVSFGSQTVAVDSQTNDEALYKAQKQLEDARALSRESFFMVNSSATTTDDIYKKEVLVDWIDDYVKKITSRVVWKTDPLRGQKVELSTLITTWENALRGDTCDPQMSGDWTDPQVLGYIDIVSDKGATDIDTRLHKVYMTSDPSAAGNSDFYVIDVSNPSSPSIMGQKDTGNGLVALRVTGQYAFAANRSINGQLQIIDISIPTAPMDKMNFKIPVPGDPADSCDDGYGKSIFLKNDIIYLGLTKTDKCPEFNMIDVSEPLNPQYLGGWNATTSVNSIYVRNNIAYLATPQPNPSTPEKENLSILDISDPTNIIRKNYFTAVDATIQSGESFFFDGNILYFGRSYGGKRNEDKNKKELFILDVSDPFNLIDILGSKKILAGGIFSSILRGAFLFVIARVDAEANPNSEFQIWDVSDPSNISDDPYAAIKIEQGSTGGMDCEGNLIYIAQRSNRALKIIGPKL